ncbi:MAG TPA: M1 family metallopeptidase [Parafilimonas sp.]|nr:M1 family metallopeptidase [Parafilimonas sp.]
MKYFIFLMLLFSSRQTFAQFTSGGKLKPEQAIMDIRHYTIALDVNIPEQFISGYTTIDFNLLQPTHVLLFNLLDSFHIKSITVNNKKQSFDYKNNLITINLANELPAGKASVTVVYEGNPHTAIRPPWDDGFTWTKDSLGNPWVAVTAEASGGKLFFPCKDHPSDEPNEGAELIITVPKGLVVAGPGLLKKTTTKKDKTTYNWNTNYTINNYSILFNIGKYKVVSRNYTTVNGNKVPMQFYVLEEHAEKAEHHLDVLEQFVRVREKYFGEYPWAKEKIGIVETPHLGMEHQTMNAYGNQFKYTKIGSKDYDWLMNHEFGHEWWGNKVTVKDWADYWIHEGIGSFGDALYVRDMEGEDAYINFFKQRAFFENKKPIVQGKDLDEESAYIGDIYSKGSFFMHTLRFVIGDSIFFPTLKQFATAANFTYDNFVATDDVEQFFSKNSGIDLQPLFNLFLRTTNRLEIHVQRAPKDTFAIKLDNLDMTIPLQITTDKGTETIMVGKEPISVASTALPVVDPNMYYFERIVIE